MTRRGDSSGPLDLKAGARAAQRLRAAAQRRGTRYLGWVGGWASATVPAVSAGTAAKKDLRSHFYLRAASRNPGSSSANRSIVRGGTGQTTRAARRTAPEQVSNPQPPISRPCALTTALSRQCHRPYGARCRLAVGAARAAAGSGWFDSEGPSGSQRSVSCRHRTASQKRCRLIHSPKCRPSPVSR